jgi:hypothetical protein
MALASLLYIPQPASAEIYLTYKDQKMNLREAVLLLAGVLLTKGYQQPANNYTIFSTALYSQFEDNTVEDWLGQGALQHQIVNYATYLGVQLRAPQAKKAFVEAV